MFLPIAATDYTQVALIHIMVNVDMDMVKNLDLREALIIAIVDSVIIMKLIMVSLQT